MHTDLFFTTGIIFLHTLIYKFISYFIPNVFYEYEQYSVNIDT